MYTLEEEGPQICTENISIETPKNIVFVVAIPACNFPYIYQIYFYQKTLALT